MPKLTKRDIVSAVADKYSLTHLEAYGFVQTTLDEIVSALGRGETVELRKFGVFEPRLTRPRLGRNPKAPEKEVLIPERVVVRFTAGKTMRERTRLLKSSIVQDSDAPSENSSEFDDS